MIEVVGLSKAFGGQDLFRDADLRINAGDRAAVVGPNGAGKTTLFEILTGSVRPDHGEVRRPKDLSIGFLRQETDPMRGRSVLEEVLTGRSQLRETGRRIDALHAELSVADQDHHDRLVAELGELQHRFEVEGGYAVEHEAKAILGGLGFKTADVDRPTESFSGGWMMRIALARLLLAKPDLLLLDEPTNHLDLESVVWLERFLSSYGGTVVFTSHDREFINGFARKVIEVRDLKLNEYAGNFDDFVEQVELLESQLRQAAAQQARKIQATERFINRFRYKKTKAKQVQSRVRMLEKMDRIEVAKPSRRPMKLRFPNPPRIGRVAMELDQIRFAYDQTSVFDDLNLDIEGDWKVALVGPNGAGKTTLLKLIAGVLTPQAGTRRPGANVGIGYFAQHQIEALDPSNSVIEELEGSVPPGVTINPRDLLGRFMFSGDAVFKPVSVLSGGEKTRLAMAKLLVAPYNLLCLDEPTNHLDMQSRDVVGEALAEFPGAIVLITHDRNLIREVATRIVQVVDGEVTVFDGNYDYYLEQVESTPAPVRTSKVDTPGSVRRARERRDRSARADVRRLKAKLTQLEREMESVSNEAESVSRMLADPQTYSRWDKDQIAELVDGYERSTKKLKDLESAWEELAQRLESAETI